MPLCSSCCSGEGKMWVEGQLVGTKREGRCPGWCWCRLAEHLPLCLLLWPHDMGVLADFPQLRFLQPAPVPTAATTKDHNLGRLTRQKCVLSVPKEGQTPNPTPSAGSRAGSLLACPASGGSQRPLACGCFMPTSASSAHLAFSASSLLFHQRFTLNPG